MLSRHLSMRTNGMNLKRRTAKNKSTVKNKNRATSVGIRMKMTPLIFLWYLSETYYTATCICYFDYYLNTKEILFVQFHWKHCDVPSLMSLIVHCNLFIWQLKIMFYWSGILIFTHPRRIATWVGKLFTLLSIFLPYECSDEPHFLVIIKQKQNFSKNSKL